MKAARRPDVRGFVSGGLLGSVGLGAGFAAPRWRRARVSCVRPGRPRERVILAASQQAPGDDGELVRDGDGRDLPGIVISRRPSRSPTACCAMTGLTRDLAAEEVQLPERAVARRRSSVGSSCSASHARPCLPNSCDRRTNLEIEAQHRRDLVLDLRAPLEELTAAWALSALPTVRCDSGVLCRVLPDSPRWQLDSRPRRWA